MNKCQVAITIRKHLIDTFKVSYPEESTDVKYYGIFDELASKGDSTMKNYINDENKDMLNYMYYFNRSGDKPISRLYQRLFDFKVGGVVTEDKEYYKKIMAVMANIVLTKYGKLWNDYYNELSKEYDALYSHNEETTETPNITITDESTSNASQNTNNDIYGFNSGSASNDTSSDVTSSSDVSGTRKETGNRDTIKKWYDSPTEALSKELDFRFSNQLYERIFKDLDSLLVLPTYDVTSLATERIIVGPKGKDADIVNVTAEVGTNNPSEPPSVEVELGGIPTEREFYFTFNNIKGEKGDTGDNAIISEATATIDNLVNKPNVKVTLGGTESDRTFAFAFSGLMGVTFTPSVDVGGNISWTNNGGLDNPTTQNIKGPQGERGPEGEQGPQGEQGIPGYVNEGAISFDVQNGDLIVLANDGEELPNYYSLSNGYMIYTFDTEGA